MIPESIGSFRIQRELGRGGMGEVYLAVDTRLDRRVAIKALPADVARDPDRLARFEREAKVLASLNHPAVGSIYGVEDFGGRRYLVLEFVEGATLAERIAKGALPIGEALLIARQIAQALEAAHEKGIIHRDLKPGNVMVGPEGLVKVLDFGLARAADDAPASAADGVAPSAAITSPVLHSPTIPGAIMGTAGYMSPEQARGRPVDRRSDVFAFGCVLYETLSGTRAFPGETVADLIGAVLHREPDWTRLPSATPIRIRELLEQCVAKDPRNRLHDIADVRLCIDRALAAEEWRTEAEVVPARRARRRWWVLLPVAIVLFGGGLFFDRFLPGNGNATKAQALHLSTSVPRTPRLASVSGIAPDSRFVIYRAISDKNKDDLWFAGVLAVQRLDRDEALVIEGTEGAIEAALSDDGRWLAFVAADGRSRERFTLKKIALDDGRPIGTPESLCAVDAGRGVRLCWVSSREIALAITWSQRVLVVPATGGEPRIVARGADAPGVESFNGVHPFGEGKLLLTRVELREGAIRERTEVLDVGTGARTPFLENAGDAQVLAGGEFLVARRNLQALVAMRLDMKRAAVVGEPVAVWSGRAESAFFVSSDGTLATTLRSGDASSRTLALLDRRGEPQALDAPPRAYGEIEISPDGERAAIALESSESAEIFNEILVHDLSRRTSARLSVARPVISFAWSGDGKRLTYSTIDDGGFSIWSRRADGSDEPVKIYAGADAQSLLRVNAWSPDDKTLAFTQARLSKTGSSVLMLEKDSEGAWIATPYLNSSASIGAVRFSPDGKRLSFTLGDSGRPELFMQPFSGARSGSEDAGRGRVQVSSNGAAIHSWSREGTKIRYLDLEGNVLVADVDGTLTTPASEPDPVRSIKDLRAGSGAFLPDGRLMLVLHGEDERASRIDIVVNFVDEVRRRMAEPK